MEMTWHDGRMASDLLVMVSEDPRSDNLSLKNKMLRDLTSQLQQQADFREDNLSLAEIHLSPYLRAVLLRCVSIADEIRVSA
jgi:hypothetical protein